MSLATGRSEHSLFPCTHFSSCKGGVECGPGRAMLLVIPRLWNNATPLETNKLCGRPSIKETFSCVMWFRQDQSTISHFRFFCLMIFWGYNSDCLLLEKKKYRNENDVYQTWESQGAHAILNKFINMDESTPSFSASIYAQYEDDNVDCPELRRN